MESLAKHMAKINRSSGWLRLLLLICIVYVLPRVPTQAHLLIFVAFLALIPAPVVILLLLHRGQFSGEQKLWASLLACALVISGLATGYMYPGGFLLLLSTGFFAYGLGFRYIETEPMNAAF